MAACAVNFYSAHYLKNGDHYARANVRCFVTGFVQLGFNLSDGVTDRLESSSILIYLQTHTLVYIHIKGLDAILNG
jgi:hypothetical protein